MSARTDFPHPIVEIENTWIRLTDGVRLATRIWMPEDAPQHPVPAILEYLPYRLNDGTVLRDLSHHPYFAGHGYAAVRVDMRGTGESDGILYDEYLPQEQDDALEVLSWIAAQPWCSGQIGIIGISWGGFNGLQIAARRPPELKTIITICSTDDRYADDVHYMGGCLLGSDMLSWSSVMFAYNALPPDPHYVGEDWRQTWFERMEQTPPYVNAWLSHPHRDEFWKQGSVIEDYEAITCPVYVVGGWADAYTNAVPRLLAGLNVPRKGLIGPWSHNYPERGVPGPAIGFMQECLRWWDYWLKDIDTGIMDEPMLRVWMMDGQPPRTHYEHRPGRWAAEGQWPPAGDTPRRYYLKPGRLALNPVHEELLEIRGSQIAGQSSNVWCPYGRPGELAGDQRIEDGLSLSFTTDPLPEGMQILGYPEATLEVSADRPDALLAVRLCDISPEGASTLVTWGLLNLTHRESHEHPTPLEPGKRCQVTVRLNAIGYVLPREHSWRLAISPTYWPHAWPSPQAVTLSLYAGENSYLSLPVRLPNPLDGTLAPFQESEWAGQNSVQVMSPGDHRRWSTYDINQGVLRLTQTIDSGEMRILRHGLQRSSTNETTYEIMADDPLSANVSCSWEIKMKREDWSIRIETQNNMSSDGDSFRVINILNAYEGNTRVFTKSWNVQIPRWLV